MNEQTVARILEGLLPTPAPVEERIRVAAARMRAQESSFQVKMEHLLFAGMYARTCRVPAEMAFTSVAIKIPTVLIVHGDCYVLAGLEWRRLRGYNVLAANAGRINAYYTVAETEITMLFPTRAATVAEAEAEFTDEADVLLSRRRPEDDMASGDGLTGAEAKA